MGNGFVNFWDIKAYQVLVGKRQRRHISFKEAYNKVKNIKENGGKVKDVI